jgi:hypothetical protein
LRRYFGDACKKLALRVIDLRENTLFAKDFLRRDPALSSARRGYPDTLSTREFALPPRRFWFRISSWRRFEELETVIKSIEELETVIKSIEELETVIKSIERFRIPI